jgi:type II secretory pathway pseudopilin PulG
LVVVLIIGILAAIALPQYLTAIKRAKLSEVQMNVRTLGDAVENAQKLYGTPDANIKFENLDITIGKNCTGQTGCNINGWCYMIELYKPRVSAWEGDNNCGSISSSGIFYAIDEHPVLLSTTPAHSFYCISRNSEEEKLCKIISGKQIPFDSRADNSKAFNW